MRFCIEDPLDLSSTRKLNWQQLLIADFIRIYEFEVSDDDFREFARQFRFEYADEIIRGYQKPWYGGLEFDEWRRRLVDQAGT